MVYLIISIIASSTMSIVIRLSQGRIRGKFSMLAANYLACIIASLFYTDAGSLVRPGPGAGLALGLGIFNGALYMVSLLIQQQCIEKNGITLSSAFQRIGGLLVPFVASVLFFRERPAILQIMGAILAIGAIIAMDRKDKAGAAGSTLLLMLLFFADGTTGITSKIYEELGAPAFSNHFISYTFMAAFICSVAVIILKKEKFGWTEVLFGVMIGIPNFFGTKTLLAALDTVPGIVAYPVRSVSSLLVLSVAGLAVFRERLSKRQWYCIAAIVAAVALLSLGG